MTERAVLEPPPPATVDARSRSRRRLIPAPLAALLVVVAIFGAAWALVTPPFQGPDEDAHFAYVQDLGELHRLPGDSGNPVSSEELAAIRVTNADPVSFFNYAKPEWSQASYKAWLRSTHPRRDDGGGSGIPSASYPPAYYLYETVPYLLGSGGTIFGRLYLMRLFSAALLLVTATMAWLLAGEVFGRRRTLQLVTAATVALWPMLDFISAQINPDAMLYPVWTGVLWLGVKTIRRGITVRRAIALGLLLGLALVVKASSLALIPAALFCIGYGALRGRSISRRAALLSAGAAVLATALAVGAWYGFVHANGRSAYAQTGLLTGGFSNFRAFLSYLWQFYLPRLPWLVNHRILFPVISHYPVYDVWLGTGWGAFGWVTIWFPTRLYLLFLAITVVIIGAAATTGVKALRLDRRGTLRRAAPLGIFFMLAVIPYVLALHASEFNLGLPFNQGRYLFPLAGLAGLVAAQSTRIVPERFRTAVTGVMLGGLVVFQIASLWLVSTRYYA